MGDSPANEILHMYRIVLACVDEECDALVIAIIVVGSMASGQQQTLLKWKVLTVCEVLAEVNRYAIALSLLSGGWSVASALLTGISSCPRISVNIR